MKSLRKMWFVTIFGATALIGLSMSSHGDGYPYDLGEVVLGSTLMYGSVGIMGIGMLFLSDEKTSWRKPWEIMFLGLWILFIFSACAGMFLMDVPESVEITNDPNFGTMYSASWSREKTDVAFDLMCLSLLFGGLSVIVLWKFVDVPGEGTTNVVGGMT